MAPRPERKALLRVLGLFFAVAVALGATLGVGILRQPGPIAGCLREPWLILTMWAAGGVYALMGAVNVAELATMIPRAGGFYVYAREAMGDTAGFSVGWSDFLGNAVACAYAAMAMTEFLTRIVPALTGYGRTIGIGLVLGFTILQWFGIVISARVQQIASALGAAALIALTLACLRVTRPEGAMMLPPPAVAGSFFPALILAIQSIIVTYDGWYEPIYFAEETRNPGFSLPRAMFTGLALVTAIYLLLNFALLRALGPAGLAASKFAAGDAAKLLFGPSADLILAVIAIVILLTLVHLMLMTATRTLFAVSRDGLFPEIASLVALNGTPRPALAITAVVAIGLMLSGTVDRLVAIAGFFFVANYCWAYLSLLVLRHKRPQALRPFRVPCYPVPTFVVLAVSLAFLAGAVVSDRKNSIYALLLLIASYPVRLLLQRLG